MKLVRLCLLVVLILAVPLFAAAGAAPETRQGTILLEGMEEPITLTRFDSPLGYRFWYDAQMFAPAPFSEETGMDVFRPANPDALEGVSLSVSFLPQAEGTLDESAGNVLASLQAQGYKIMQVDTTTLFPLYEAAGYHAVMGQSALDTYILQAGGGEYLITATYPLAAAEGFGARLHFLAATFEIPEAK